MIEQGAMPGTGDGPEGGVAGAAGTPPRVGQGGAFPACALERLLGRPAAAWAVDDLVDLVAERGIRLVSLMHVGGDGWLKTLDFAPRDAGHLRDILEGGERADGSSLFKGLGIRTGASDILLRPRLATAFLDPFSPLPTLAVLCGHEGRDGAPLPQSPDTIVRRAAVRARARAGVELHALGEVEFFLGHRPSDFDIYGADDLGYHATSPFVFGEGLRRRALGLLADIGVPVKYGHSEVGYVQAGEAEGWIWEQHEVELALAPLERAADGVVLAQWVIRNLARREGMRVSFDPILSRGHAGNGLHFHVSPAVEGVPRGGRGPDGQLWPQAKWLIGGLVRMGGALMAFGNRGEESFVRLTQAKEAPGSVSWGEFDRRALVRLPVVAATPEGRPVSPPTVEFRLPDGSAQPHLLLAGLAQAMLAARSEADLEGLLRATASASRGAAASQGVRVPRNLREVAVELERHRAAFEADGVFPAAMLDGVLARLKA
ncbi:MAG: glutamine synthetase [Candidatus Eisenbacteria bacterium]|nr:glutamine synthetase [Candidatus Eisenbacteria bacterium]